MTNTVEQRTNLFGKETETDRTQKNEKKKNGKNIILTLIGTKVSTHRLIFVIPSWAIDLAIAHLFAFNARIGCTLARAFVKGGLAYICWQSVIYDGYKIYLFMNIKLFVKTIGLGNRFGRHILFGS